MNRCLEAHTNVHACASPLPNQRNVLAIVHRVKYRLLRVVSQYIKVSTTEALGLRQQLGQTTVWRNPCVSLTFLSPCMEHSPFTPYSINAKTFFLLLFCGF